MQNDDEGLQSAALATQYATHLLKRAKNYCACVIQNDIGHVMKHVGTSRSAAPATRNHATRRLKPPKVTTFAELPRRTAMLLRTVANTFQRGATASQPPDPQSKTRTLCYAFGKHTELVACRGRCF